MSDPSLTKVNLSDFYRSDCSDVVQDFYIPVLSQAIRYDRAVGFFTSSSLALTARGINQLIDNGGKIRIIASPRLSPEDIEQINLGYQKREEVIARVLARELDPDIVAETSSAEMLGHLGLLERLIAEYKLDIKIAFLDTDAGNLGIYHEKLGVIADGSGNKIAFNGSMNETQAAYENNFESFEVFKSWESGEAKRVDRISKHFSDMWSGRVVKIKVLDFPDAARKNLQDLARRVPRLHQPARTSTASGARRVALGWASLPEEIKLREYQKSAIVKWLEGGARGIFEMATGTGKTITALAAVDQLGRQLRARDGSLVTVIVVPLLDLVEQWANELGRFGVAPLKCRDSVQSWLGPVRNAIAGLKAGRSTTLVVTNRTFSSPTFQRVLDAASDSLLIVADEAHHLGAKHNRSMLPGHARWRLALSATPERWFDEEGTKALHDYFGETLISLGIKEAIELGALTRYRYRPVLVPLSGEEAALYTSLTARIGALYSRREEGNSGAVAETALEQLLNKRAKVLGHAEGKIGTLREEISERRHQPFQLIYCAEGARPADESTAEVPRQVDQVLALLGNTIGMRVHTYTSQEPKRERRALLDAFGSGDLEALVSMRCLDEGVDLPDARIAYMLASSSNPRQFIQRRGRILRRAPGKSEAEVVDFIAIPPQDPELFEIERNLFRREMTRVVEFAQYAENYGEALGKLRDLREYYELMDV
ncbi:DEAD/DEAH box helicase family protein [Actinomadura nitritigenes]|uniref:DEAD/DEAH box helicase family protein n=1 Tax=Actinomadura nitritigenes TaxID=134602 RepID=UPI0036AA2A6D